MIDLDGHVVIVTGAAGRIGSETARVMAELGARVVAADVAEAPLRDVVADIAASGGSAFAQVCDISDEAQVRALVAAAVDAHGRVDLLDNNAAALAISTDDQMLTDMPLELWERTMAVNLRGPMLCAKHTLPVMMAQGGGAIVNISSGMSLAGDSHHVAYGCSKGGVNSLTRYIATQYGQFGVRCNALALGIITPDALDPAGPPAAYEPYVRHKLVGRLGHPRDVAQAVAFLGSSASAYLTGQVISLDGGFFAHVPSFTSTLQSHEQKGTP
ncbi:MAG: SDR family oxidoreductase [Acidimicrobiales bacterium]|nr:SDR family oxidoreductase [Acidimicrobiales bacterium]